MLLILSQFTIKLYPDLLAILGLINILADIIILKIGLTLLKAPKRRSIRWSIVSYILQNLIFNFFFFSSVFIYLILNPRSNMGVLFFVLLVFPLFIVNLLPVAIIFLIIGLFFQLNFINVFHYLGIKKASILMGMRLIVLITFYIILLVIFNAAEFSL